MLLIPDENFYDSWNNQNKFITKLLSIEKSLNYKLGSYSWTKDLVKAIQSRNYKPPDKFIEKIFDYEKKYSQERFLINGKVKRKKDIKYIKLDEIKIKILEMLFQDGSKRIYNNKYTEHAGYLDINEKKIDNIIISTTKKRIADNDKSIYLPDEDNMTSKNYSYIFHTHPATPKIGSRIDVGIIYEFPSINDIYHFIDQFNEGKTIGSIIIAPEGLYNIKKLLLDKKPININEIELEKEYKHVINHYQNKMIKKYKKITEDIFYEKIVKKIPIKKINKVLNKYGLQIDFYKRIKKNNKWILETIYLELY